MGYWVWTIDLHRKLLFDKVRNRQFFNALKRVIKPNTTVLDLGAGTGFLGFLSSKLGAKTVYLMEADRDIVHFGKQIASASKITNVTWIDRHSTKIQKTRERYLSDVVISETLGCFALEENLVENMAEAKRFLKPDGLIIPGKVDMFIAPVLSPRFHESIAEWDKIGYELNYEALKNLSAKQLQQRKFLPADLLDDGKSAIRFDSMNFMQKEPITSPRISSNMSWKYTAQPIAIYGFCMWWTSELVPGVELTTSPMSEPTHWDQAYLPLLQPMKLAKANEKVTVELKVHSNFDVGANVMWKVKLIHGETVISVQSNHDVFGE